jgi:hypothetical protein
MVATRTRRRIAVLAILYVVAAAGLVGGGICLSHRCYLAWVLSLFAGIAALVWAYRLRTGRGPFRRCG